jgi:uncharacterized protein
VWWTKLPRLAALAAAALFFFVPHRSEAVSFDCSKAAAPRERLICGDGELSRAGEKLAAAFKAALTALSEEGKGGAAQGSARVDSLVCAQALPGRDTAVPHHFLTSGVSL